MGPGISVSGHIVTYKGKQYRIRPGYSPQSHSIGCDSGWFGKPAGWVVAPDNGDSQYVTKCLPWSTHVLVMSNGRSYGTKTYTKGRYFGSGKLSTSGNSVRVTSCSLRVLFTKGGYTGGGNGMNYAGYFWRTLDGANPHDRHIRCENHWRNIPAGCSVATNCGWIQHVARSTGGVPTCSKAGHVHTEPGPTPMAVTSAAVVVSLATAPRRMD